MDTVMEEKLYRVVRKKTAISTQSSILMAPELLSNLLMMVTF